MSVQSFLVECPVCGGGLTAAAVNRESPCLCPACNAMVYASVFPALFRKLAKGQSAEILVDNAEAGCFYHPDKRAATACEACGRFLCNLCDITLDNQHLCSGCVALSRKKGKLKNLNNHRTLYDEIAFAWALYPVIFVWPTVVTPFIAIYTSIRHWNSPTSVIQRSKAKFILAIILSLLQIAGWLALTGYFFMEKKHG